MVKVFIWRELVKILRKAGEAAFDLIKCFEGFRPKAYWCPGKILTIGYGTTIGVKAGDVVTHEEALQLLKRDISYFEDVVNSCVTVPLTQSQFDALISFVYNVGATAFKNSTLLRKLNDSDYAGAANEFTRWSFVKKVFLPGLKRRRDAEKALFLKHGIHHPTLH